MNLTKNDLLVIFIVWLIATTLNVTKPFHIDDAYHLEAAMHIAENPLQPSSGFINWGDVPEPLSQSNQPPLFFYLIALTGTLTSFSEIPLHLLVSVFTFLSILFFFLTVRYIKPKDAPFLTAIFGLSPAFLVNQNIMVDIPLLAASLAFGYYTLKAGKTGEFRYLAFAGIALGIAMLIKFTIIPLIVVMFITPFLYRKPLHLTAILIPFLFIAGWSLYNIFEFNDVQLLTRNTEHSSLSSVPERFLSFLSCIGSISPFALMMFTTTQKKPAKYVPYVVAIFLGFNIFIIASWLKIITPEFSKEIIRYVFMLLGLVVFFTIILANKTIFKDLVSSSYDSYKRTFLLLWFCSITSFIILFAPFIATRHVLLVIPAFLFLIPAIPVNFPKILKGVALIATISSGVLLSISDYHYAAFYRNHSREIARNFNGDHQIWALGHWGWQWYSRVNGFRIYNTCISDVKVGDIMVYPSKVPLQQICPLIKLERIEERWDEPGFLSFFSTRNEASFYLSGYKRPAWQLSLMPTDTIVVQRVIEVEKSIFREHHHESITSAYK